MRDAPPAKASVGAYDELAPTPFVQSDYRAIPLWVQPVWQNFKLGVVIAAGSAALVRIGRSREPLPM